MAFRSFALSGFLQRKDFYRFALMFVGELFECFISKPATSNGGGVLFFMNFNAFNFFFPSLPFSL